MKIPKFPDSFLWGEKNCKRVYLDWSKIQPTPEFFDQNVVNDLRSQILNLIENNLKPIIVLHNFILPEWILKLGGWKSKKSIGYFVKYTKFSLTNFGDYSPVWVTFESPIKYATLSYLRKQNRPYENNVFSFLKVLKNIYKSQKIVFSIIKKQYSEISVGMGYDSVNFIYHKKNLLKKIWVYILDFIYFDTYLLFLKKHLDFIFLSFYGTEEIHSFKNSQVFKHDQFSDGLGELLKKIHKHRKPILIENKSLEKIDAQIISIHYSISEGIPVYGYLNDVTNVDLEEIFVDLPEGRMQKDFLHLKYYNKSVTKIKAS